MDPREGTTKAVSGPAEAGSDLTRRLAEIALVGAAYYVSARLGLRLSLVRENVTPLWPPTGIAVVAFVILGRRVWPGVALAAFLVNLPISENAPAAAATAVGNTLAPLVAAILLERVGFRRSMVRLQDVFAIVFLGGLFSMTISATVGAATLVASDAIPGHDFGSAWAVWWTGDAMGVLVVAPFLLSLKHFRSWKAPVTERFELAALLVIVAAVAVAVSQSSLQLLFLVMPLLVWTAWRFQQRGAAPAALIVATAACWAAAHHDGPFAIGGLFERMIKLQAFNASVAFTTLVFAAVITERIRSRQILERSATELEERVQQRTAELSSANEQLAEAQHLAHVGSWEWLIPEGEISWSDELFRIHGYAPGAFKVTFAKAIEQVVPEDAAQIEANVRDALSALRSGPIPDIEYRIVPPDGAERTLLGKARLTLDGNRVPFRMVGTVQDVTDEKRAEREHRIAETLQRSLLPDRLPEIPGVLLAARYVPASAEMEVGGDWYDVVQLPNGHVGLAIGDVAGHGLRAASTMGQIRMALRAYAVEEDSAAEVVRRAHHLVQRTLQPDLVTLAYLVFDPDSRQVRVAVAGHPPPLVVEADGRSTYLESPIAPPLGAMAYPDSIAEATFELAAGATLMLFTDGLIERRGASIQDGLDRLKEVAAATEPDLEAFCDRVLGTMVEERVADDIAILALQPIPLSAEPLTLRVPAEPQVLAPLRQTLRRWLREVEVDGEEANGILIACGEACANAIQHAYGAKEGSVELGLAMEGETVEITVRDRGTWRSFSGHDGGRGLQLMHGLMDTVDVDSGSTGTTVRMRRRVVTGSANGNGEAP